MGLDSLSCVIGALQLTLAVGVFTLEGVLPDDGVDYAPIQFEVTEGTEEVEIAQADHSRSDVLDWGVWSPQGFRGWSNASEEPIVIGAVEASPGYLPGPLEPGTWTLLIGKAHVARGEVAWSAEVTLRTESTLPHRARAAWDSVQLSAERRWYKGDFHVHSSESGDGTASLEEVAAFAQHRGLDFIVVTDHNTVSHHGLMAALQKTLPNLLLIRGSEVTTYAGHGNALGTHAYVDHRVTLDGRSIGDVFEDVETQGGLFVVNHPAVELGSHCVGCAWQHADTPWNRVGAWESVSGRYEIATGLFSRKAMALWDAQLAAGARPTGIGGSDDHHGGAGQDPLQSIVGTPTTAVFAEQLSEAAILEGVRKGRAVVQLRAPHDPFVELTATNEDGVTAMVGDTVVGDDVVLTARVTGGAGLDLRLLENGVVRSRLFVWTQDAVHQWRVRPGNGDRFRVHLGTDTDVVITNHVFLQPKTITCACAQTRPRAVGLAGLLLAAVLMCKTLGRWVRERGGR
jgi:hypothetical protein